MDFGNSDIKIEIDGATFVFENLDLFETYEMTKETEPMKLATFVLSKLKEVQNIEYHEQAVSAEDIKEHKIKIPFSIFSKVIRAYQSALIGTTSAGAEKAEKNDT